MDLGAFNTCKEDAMSLVKTNVRIERHERKRSTVGISSKYQVSQVITKAAFSKVSNHFVSYCLLRIMFNASRDRVK